MAEGITKKHKGILGSDGYVYYLRCNDSLMGQTCQFTHFKYYKCTFSSTKLI